MRIVRSSFTVVLAILTVFSALAAFADDAAEKGRQVLDKHKTAVVTVKLVIKMKYSSAGGESQEREITTEATGVVIGADGLTLVSLSAVDPASVSEGMRMRSSDFSVESELSDAKIISDDGTEIDAREILRDRDLDLAFLRPVEKPKTPFKFVSLEDDAKPQILDQMIALNRLGKVNNRAYSVSIERIEAIVDKPRTFYIPGDNTSSAALGSPVFSLDGKIIGVGLLRTIKSDSDSMSMRDNMSIVILPAEDILEGAQQAPPFDE